MYESKVRLFRKCSSKLDTSLAQRYFYFSSSAEITGVWNLGCQKGGPFFYYWCLKFRLSKRSPFPLLPRSKSLNIAQEMAGNFCWALLSTDFLLGWCSLRLAYGILHHVTMAEKREHPQQHLKHMKKTEIGLLKQKIANNHMQKNTLWGVYNFSSTITWQKQWIF